MARAAINNFPELDIPNLESLFTEIQYPKDYEIIKSSKDKDATLFNGYYYNFSRKNYQLTLNKQQFRLFVYIFQALNYQDVILRH